MSAPCIGSADIADVAAVAVAIAEARRSHIRPRSIAGHDHLLKVVYGMLSRYCTAAERYSFVLAGSGVSARGTFLQISIGCIRRYLETW